MSLAAVQAAARKLAWSRTSVPYSHCGHFSLPPLSLLVDAELIHATQACSDKMWHNNCA